MGLEELDPLRDLDNIDFTGFLEGETLADIASQEALRYWPGKLKAIVRGGSAGLLIGGALSYAADFPADQGAAYGMLLFGVADASFYEHRYTMRCMKETFGAHPLALIGKRLLDRARKR